MCAARILTAAGLKLRRADCMTQTTKTNYTEHFDKLGDTDCF